ncbi:MAG: quinone-dependent dihydroorotate dehydrogenase [Leptospiraceae bacterium]|nr:quinone-dependent dihydroorotate dehydrogenase [Leptospiraceae bacterium]
MKTWIYETTLKPIFFKLGPEDAHHLAKSLLDISHNVPLLFDLIHKATTYQSSRLTSKVNGILFPNPLGMAAGFDKTGELYPYLAKLGFGFVEVGTITGEAQEGNPKPRLFRYEKDFALVNRMGFNNLGCEKTAEILRKQQKIVPRGINVGKTKIVSSEKAVDDYVKSINLLVPYADYLVINISSPNTPGLRDFQEKENFIQLIKGIQSKLDSNFSVPIFVKFAPDLETSYFEELLEVVLSLRLNGVVVTNTTIDKKVLKHYPPETIEQGGISGLVLEEKSTEFVRIARKVLKGRIPIIGVGGIFSPELALKKILAGADLIQIYTGYIYKGPFFPYMILKYIDKFLEKEGVKAIQEIVGQEKK